MTNDRYRETESYRLGQTNMRENLSGPNPYAEESQDWLNWELGWGEGCSLEEEKHRVDAEMHLQDARQSHSDMKGGN